MNVWAVPPGTVKQMSVFIRPLIEKACSRDCPTPPDTLIQEAIEGKRVMWIIAEDYTPLGVCFTRIVEEGRKRVLWLTCAGGVRGREWIPDLRVRLHEYREDEGAEYGAWHGRKGWARVLGLPPAEKAEAGWNFKDYGG